MRLSPKQVTLFYKLYPSLLLFVNKRYQIEDVEGEDELMALSVKKRLVIRDALYENIELIDEFVNLNPLNFSLTELEIISSWKHYVKGEFFLLKQLNNGAIFLTLDNKPKVYSVLAVADLFENFFTHMPIEVETILLPFQGRIIYDGLIASNQVLFGSGYKRSFNETYNETKAKYGIITSLPHEEEEKTTSDSDLLKYYLRNKINQEQYWDEIQLLISESEQNKILYYQEIGKYFAKRKAKRLKELGIKKGWFAILENLIVGSGGSKEDVVGNIEAVVPEKQKNYLYLFELKAKKK